MLLCDISDNLLLKDTSSCQGCVGCHHKIMVIGVVEHRLRNQKRVKLKLVAEQRYPELLDRLLHQRQIEVAHADIDRLTLITQSHHGLKRPLQRDIRVGPVYQKQIQIGCIQVPQAILDSLKDIIVLQIRMPYLGCNEELLPISPRYLYRLSDLRFIFVHLCCIDVGITQIQCLAKSLVALTAIQFIRSQSDLGHLYALNRSEEHT